MGWFNCSACDERDSLQPCCEHSSEGSLCDSCYEDRKRKECEKCGSNFCENHGDFIFFLCEICNEDSDEDDDEDNDDDDDGKRENITKTVPPENNSRKRDGVADDDDVVDSGKSNKKCKADADVEVIVID